MQEQWQRIHAVVKKIPKGRVATYGQVARLAGLPRRARLVGYVLSALEDERVPWHRVVNSQGAISGRSEPLFVRQQRELLEQEGVVFSAAGRLSLSRFRWKAQPAPFSLCSSTDKP